MENYCWFFLYRKLRNRAGSLPLGISPGHKTCSQGVYGYLRAFQLHKQLLYVLGICYRKVHPYHSENSLNHMSDITTAEEKVQVSGSKSISDTLS